MLFSRAICYVISLRPKRFFPATFSQTPSVYVSPLMSDFTPIQKYRQNYSFVYSNFCAFRQTRTQKILHWMLTNVTRIQSAFKFPLNQILICYCHSQIFELCRIFKLSVSSLCVIIVPCILMMRQQHIWIFLKKSWKSLSIKHFLALDHSG
jgi:hypothetical protein